MYNSPREQLDIGFGFWFRLQSGIYGLRSVLGVLWFRVRVRAMARAFPFIRFGPGSMFRWGLGVQLGCDLVPRLTVRLTLGPSMRARDRVMVMVRVWVRVLVRGLVRKGVRANILKKPSSGHRPSPAREHSLVRVRVRDKVRVRVRVSVTVR